MCDTLSIDKARELIEFIFNTNYNLAPFGDGCFESKSEALAFVQSEKYLPDEALSVVFGIAIEDHSDSVQITFSNDTWYAEDMEMGGVSASGKDIFSALTNYRNEVDANSDYYPQELVIKG